MAAVAIVGPVALMVARAPAAAGAAARAAVSTATVATEGVPTRAEG